MNDHLWAGSSLKLEAAFRHLTKMSDALQPPERTGRNAAIQAHGGIIDTRWQERFYPEVDAFLAAARSVPWIIEACFGKDIRHPMMQAWWKTLTAVEHTQRQQFHQLFAPVRAAFEALPLTAIRDQSLHRSGVAPVEVVTKGRFGIYTGSAAVRLPLSETRGINDELAFLDMPLPIQPMWTDFKIDGRPLFAEFQGYLQAAFKLIADARAIAATVHQGIKLTAPPS